MANMVCIGLVRAVALHCEFKKIHVTFKKQVSMKGNYFLSLVEMDSEARQQLVTEVKETLATGAGLANNEKASFKAVDLWKMERNKKSATRTFSGKRNEIPFI